MDAAWAEFRLQKKTPDGIEWQARNAALPGMGPDVPALRARLAM